MFAALQRHPFPVVAFFDYSLVLTYAVPENRLRPLLPPGLELDGYEGFGFVAIALVQTRGLRPAGFPGFLGRDFFLSGYRIFARYRRTNGQVLRGLRILRSDTNSATMAFSGNLLTHYNYRVAQVETSRQGSILSLAIRTPQAEADLELSVDLSREPAAPPHESPFPDLRTARRFAGPLPFTFDYEKETHSIVLIEGKREHWEPKPVDVHVRKATFFDGPLWTGAAPRLANAFYIEKIPYRWKRGEVEKLSGGMS